MDTTPRAGRRDVLQAGLLAGFTSAVLMWAAGYLAHLPAVKAPGWVLLPILVLCLLFGGWMAGRDAGRTGAGTVAGLVSAAVNLLVLGSLAGPWMLYGLPGYLAISALLGFAGGRLGAKGGGRGDPADRPGLFARTTVLATILVVFAGGLVTTKGAGLDVPDWPQSFGTNMFLFPLRKMTGGIYYEHAHRLFGTLVGLCLIVLVAWIFAADRRRSMKLFAVVLLVLVVAQGIFGGLRVTETSLPLAAVHGVLGQSILALLVALSALLSRAWRTGPAPVDSPRAGADRKLGASLAALLLLQIALGAMLRHFDKMLHPHITVAVVVFAVALIAGFRAWGIHGGIRPLRRVGIWLIVAMVAQLALGFGALVARPEAHLERGPVATLVITIHQATGAVLLAATTLHVLYVRRFLRPAPPAA